MFINLLHVFEHSTTRHGPPQEITQLWNVLLQHRVICAAISDQKAVSQKKSSTPTRPCLSAWACVASPTETPTTTRLSVAQLCSSASLNQSEATATGTSQNGPCTWLRFVSTKRKSCRHPHMRNTAHACLASCRRDQDPERPFAITPQGHQTACNEDETLSPILRRPETVAQTCHSGPASPMWLYSGTFQDSETTRTTCSSHPKHATQTGPSVSAIRTVRVLAGHVTSK